MNLIIAKIKEIKASQWLFWGVIVMFAIAHVLIYVIMPYTCDDYWYMTPIADYCNGIDTSFPFSDLWGCWVNHYETDNIRLANIIFTFTLLLPKVIPSIISGLLVSVVLWLSAKLSAINWRNPLLMMLLALMLSFMLPWYEEMLTQCFALNYIWSTALALYLGYVFFKDHQLHSLLSMFLGLLLGAWHEGIAGPMLIGFIVYLVLKRSMINRRRIMMIVGLVFGLLWLASAPGLQANVGVKTNSVTVMGVLGKLILYHTPLVLLMVSILIASLKKNLRKLIVDPLFISFVAICVTGVALNLITNVGVRTGWMGYLFGIIATIYLWRSMKEARYSRGKSLFKRALTIVIASFLLLHYVVVVYYTVKVKNEYEYVLSQYDKSPDGLVFADVTYDYQASPLAWKKPYFEIFTYDWVMLWIDNYFNQGAKRMCVIPTCLRSAEHIDAMKVKGNNPFMIYDGHLFAPLKDDESVAPYTFYEIDFGVTKKILKCSNFTFTTSSGNRYYFSFPQRATVHRWIGDIENMNEVKVE